MDIGSGSEKGLTTHLDFLFVGSWIDVGVG